MTSGHLPLHAGYIIIFWPIYQVSQSLGLNPAFIVILGQIILALLAIYFFYLFIKIISDKTLAFYAALIASLTPMFWIANVTIMMETTYLIFFVLTLYFLAKYSKHYCSSERKQVENSSQASPDLSKNKRSKSHIWLYLILSVCSFIISALAHLGVIIWIPLLLYTSYFLNKKTIFIYLSSIIGGIVVFSLLNGAIISISQNISLTEGIISLYSAKLGEHARFNFDIQSILVYARNFIIPLLRNNTSLIVILSVITLIKMYSKNRKMCYLGFLWILPSFVANQWWDSVLFGRHSLIAGFGFAFLAAYLLKKSKIVFLILSVYLLIVSLPAINLLKEEIPYLQEAKFVKQLSNDSLLIETHFARPQVDKMYKGKIIFVDEPGWEKERLSDQIRTYLLNHQSVFVSSQALSEPYGLYSGPYLHILSLSYKNDFVLKPIIEQFNLKEYSVINRKDNLMIYQITSDKPSPYPHVKNMKEHRRRIDYSDPLLFLYNKLKLFNVF